jgi:hypothetical protein
MADFNGANLINERTVLRNKEMSFEVLNLINREKFYKSKAEQLEADMTRLLKHNELLQSRYESKVVHSAEVEFVMPVIAKQEEKVVVHDDSASILD